MNTPYTDLYDPKEPGKASDSVEHALERLAEAIAQANIANDDVIVLRLCDLIGHLRHPREKA